MGKKAIELEFKLKSKNLFSGNTASNIKGAGLEYEELREYAPGDEVKHIDWIISARENKPYVKQFEEDKDLKMYFLIDVGYDMSFGMGDRKKTDTLIETVELLSYSAIKSGYPINAFTFTDKMEKYVPPMNNFAGIISVLNSIKIVQKKSDLNKFLSFFVKNKLKPGVIFLITDKTELDKGYVKYLSQKHKFFVINIFDSFENELNGEGMVNFVDFGSNIFVNLSNKFKKKKYRNYRQEKIKDFGYFLAKNRAKHIVLNEKNDIYKTLLKSFKNF